jgi:PAS domain S-box-containing protein
LPDAVLVHCSGTLVFVNPATVTLLGATSAQQLLGRRIFDFIHPDFIPAIEARIRRFPTLRVPDTPLEHLMVALDGSTRDVEGLAIPITWEGAPAIEVVIRDISERRLAQHSAHEWNTRMELARRSGLKIGLWQWDLSSHKIEWSDETCRQYGLTRETFSGRVEDATERIHPADLARVKEAIEKSIANSTDYAAQYRTVWPDGNICWIDARGSVVRDGSTRMIGISVDVTEFKKTEEVLLESQQNQLQLLNSTAEGIFGLDLDGCCTFSNPAAARTLGYESPDGLVGRFVHRDHHSSRPDGTACVRSFRTGEETHCDSEFFHRTDGTYFPVEYWSYPTRRNGEIVGCVVTFLDITRRRQAQDALRGSEERYRLFFEQNPQPMWVYEKPSLRFIAVNQSTIDHYGYSREEFLGMNLRDIRPEEDIPELLEDFSSNRAEGDLAPVIWRHRTKDGRIIFVEISDRELVLDGRSANLVAANDVTDRLRAEDALRASEEKYREFMENTTFGIYRSAPDGRLFDVNPALVSMLGYDSKKELMSCNLNTSVYEKQADRAAILEAVRVDHRVQGVVTNWKRKDGSIIVVRLDGKEISKEGRISHYEVTVEDITERRVLEDQLRQSQKMEAIGRLAGGVAHDFNNALGVITGYSELLQFKLVHDETLHRQAGEILKAGQKAASLTRQLLAFSRKQTLRPQALNLNNVVRDVDKMLRRLIGENIDLVHVDAPDLAVVMADPGQMEQVLMNLAVNARDAMPRGGRLKIESSNAVLDAEIARRYRYVKPGNYAMLSVTDTGCGMDEQVQSKIFEPFFTTKDDGKGTGLGLSTVYGIVKQSGGYIWVDSAPGEGARFRIYLPASANVPESQTALQTGVPTPHGSETVLLVEDETSLRELACASLRGAGYNVLEAGSAESALAIVKQFGGRIHLLLTDVILPGISGRDLSSRLSDSYPETKTIFMSGYTDDLLGDHGVLGPDIILLEKPFSNKTLLKTIRQVLDT